MTSVFTIREAAGVVRCNPNGIAEHRFTVTNVDRKTHRLGVKALVDHPTDESWLSFDAMPEEYLDATQSRQVTARIRVPADTPTGRYTYRLLAFAADNPGELYAESDPVALEVTSEPAPVPPQKPKKFPYLIVASAVSAVLLIGGVVAYLLSSDEITVPDALGMTIAEATDALEDIGLAVRLVDAAAPNAFVATQVPAAGTSVAPETEVSLTAKAVAQLRPTKQIYVNGQCFRPRDLVFCGFRSDNQTWIERECNAPGFQTYGRMKILAAC